MLLGTRDGEPRTAFLSIGNIVEKTQSIKLQVCVITVETVFFFIFQTKSTQTQSDVAEKEPGVGHGHSSKILPKENKASVIMSYRECVCAEGRSLGF